MENKIHGLGIDQGIANCGYSLVSIDENDEIKVLCSGTIKTYAKYTEGRRLQIIVEKLSEVIEGQSVDIIGVERLFFNPVMKVGKRNKSASMMQTNMVSGAIHLFSEIKNIKIKEFVPGTVKKLITGSGKGTKEDIDRCVKEALGTGFKPKSEHESDATAIAITAAKYAKSNPVIGYSSIKTKVPKKKKKNTKNKTKKEDSINA